MKQTLAATASPQQAPLAVSARGLGKCYEIYQRPYHRLLKRFAPRAKHLSRDFWALRGVDLEIRRGETVAIIGRNGSGKSTLLQVLCGILSPTEGTIQIQGRVSALLELGAGFNPEFTGIENVVLNASILGLSQKQIDARMDAILEFAGIGEFAYQPVKVYSSGMYLRLAFAVAAHVDADILVIDEALAVGDALFVQKCMRFLRRFQQTGTVIFVSHSTSLVTSLCQRAYWLEQGTLRMVGDAKSVTESFLEHLYEGQQRIARVAAGARKQTDRHPRADEEVPEQPPLDMRRELLLHSNLRNDLQVLQFDIDREGFGEGDARILDVSLLNEQGRRLSWVIGGESVVLSVRFLAQRDISDAIVGFLFKNHLGQILFGDNTFLTHRGPAALIPEGSAAIARFRFRLPYLPPGDYVISVAIAEGRQDEHVQHHWIHDALMIRCENSHTVFGLLGIPMSGIELQIEHPDP